MVSYVGDQKSMNIIETYNIQAIGKRCFLYQHRKPDIHKYRSWTDAVTFSVKPGYFTIFYFDSRQHVINSYNDLRGINRST